MVPFLILLFDFFSLNLFNISVLLLFDHCGELINRRERHSYALKAIRGRFRLPAVCLIGICAITTFKRNSDLLVNIFSTILYLDPI